MRHTQKRAVARGTIRETLLGEVYRETCVRWDSETFEEVRQHAIKRGTSFGEAARVLVELGLECEREMEEFNND